MQGLDNPTVTREAKYFIDFTNSKKKNVFVQFCKSMLVIDSLCVNDLKYIN